MRVAVTTQAEFDAAVARGDSVEVRAGSFTVRSKALVTAYDDAVVLARGNAEVTAHDNAQVSAYHNARVWAYDNVRVFALDHAQVWASGNARVYAYENAVVRRALPIDPEWRKLYERELAAAKEAA